MSYFSDTAGCTLVNNFTLHHADKMSSGRPFMSTCVPRSIWLDLHDIEIQHGIQWLHTGFDERPPGSPDFKNDTCLHARGTYKDTITVFRVAEGAVGSFREIDVTIRPTKSGSVGGEKKGTTRDGIAYSGMSSTTVPDEGLMTGDPGVLMYTDPRDDKWPTDKKEPYLSLEAYIDEAQFSALIQRMSMTSAPIRKGVLRMVAELFQNEVESSLSEPWYAQDYGLLLRGEDSTYGLTRARAENISISFKPTQLADPSDPRVAEALDEEEFAKKKSVVSINDLPPELVAKISKDMLVKIERRLGVLTGIVGFAAAFVIGKILLG